MTTPPPCRRCGEPIPPTSPGSECPACLLELSLSRPAEREPVSIADYQPHFPHLELLAPLGRGGMGVVFQARHTGLNRLVAVKLLAPERAANPLFAERFLREAQALARLSHPHIVAVHDVGRAADTVYLVMEYVPGSNLRDRLRAGRLDAREALRVIPQLCDAVQYAHDRGVIHRDIKPENVLLDPDGNAKVADFGLAKFEDDEFTLTDSGERMGTARYMAPEQWADTGAVDHRADIYSLGVLFYEMLTGDLPGPRCKPPSEKAGTDPRLDKVVSKSLEEEPAERYQRADEIKTDVQRIAATARTRWPLAAAVAGSILLAAVVVAVVTNRGDPGHPPTQPTQPPTPPVAVGPPTPGEILTSPDWVWTEPVNLGPTVNTEHRDAAPCLSADGLVLLFHSDRPGGQGDLDLWESRRKSAAEQFGEPVNLGAAVNGPALDESACLSADGLTLLFVSNRAGGSGGNDIWMARRATTVASWETPVNLGGVVNSPSHEYRPWLSGDGLTLTFSSLREPRDGLWRARRPTVHDPFGEPAPFGRQSHLRAVAGPSFTTDGRVMLLHRFNRAFPDDLLWLSRLDSPDEPFRNLRSFGPTVNGPHVDPDPVASPDGRSVYFASDRPGGEGGYDIWRTDRVPRE